MSASSQQAVSRVGTACTLMHVAGGPVALHELAAATCVSERQLQRDFTEVLGTSPRQYGGCVRTTRARRELSGATSVTDAIFDAGSGSVRAFYDEAARRLGMTPRDYAMGAPQHLLLWSITPTKVGNVLAVASPQGLCSTGIGEPDELTRNMLAEFPNSVLIRDDDAMRDVMVALAFLAGGQQAPELPLHVQGTAFQARVWSALRTIPAGQTRTYTQIAEAIDEPQAVRAVANACGANPAALAIPCHRVIRADGSLGGYYWGIEIKQSLLAAESA